MSKLSKENMIKLTAALLFVAVLAAIYLINPGFFTVLWKVTSSGNMNEIIAYISSFGVWALLVSFMLDVLINALGFLPSIFLSTANGLLFGVAVGVIVSWLAETVGVIISFLLMRGVMRSSAESIIRHSPYLQKLDDFSGKNGFKVMLLARMMPYFPSGILTALGAVSKISVRDYMLSNLIGKFPSTALEVIIGHDVVNYQKNLDRLMLVVLAVAVVYVLIWRSQRKKA